jgi:hypothetical protein
LLPACIQDKEAAAKAYATMHGRKFDGKSIAAAFTTVDLFATLMALAASAAAAAPQTAAAC